jgi:uncharacterized repeat protein (TIGR01451 family)
VSIAPRFGRTLRAGSFCVAFAVAALAGPAANAGYVQVYSTIQKGALTFTGNTLELGGNAVANSGTPGTSATGGAFIAVELPGTRYGTFPFGTTGPTAQYVNNSSRAVLSVPPGATVLYAELIWSGTIGTLTAGQLNSNVTFKTPSGGSYTISPNGATAGNSGTYYTRSANVTGLVQIGGSGTYTTGGVPGMVATSGTTDAAGWTLAVAYADPSQVARNLTIFVGAEQAGAAPASVSGFCTPVSGLVNGRLLVSGIEGDSSGTGDTMLFGPTSTLGAGNRLSGPNNPIGNFFASQINGDSGNLDTSGTFGGQNSTPGTNLAGARQGYDITNVDATSQLRNSQTTAFAQGTTTGDNYAINSLGLQINVTSPVFPVSVKTVNKSSTFVGDTLHYAVNLDNAAGNGAANGVTFFDTLPAGMALVANSVTLNGSVQAGADPAAGVAVGNIPVGAVAVVGFDVRVVSLPASPAPARFDNAARWNYTYVACAGAVAQAGTVTTSVVSTPAARLEPAKTVSPTGALVGGQTATYTIAIPNTGLLDTSGTTVADPIPAGMSYVAGSTKLNGVTVGDGAGATMPFATAALVNSAGKAAGVIAAGAAATLQFSVVAAGPGTVQNVATIDPDGAGPGTAMTVSAVNSILIGPGVAKAFTPASIGAGGRTTLTVTLSNPNAQTILAAAMTDNLPSGMVIANPANAATTCAGAAVAATPSGTTLAVSGATIPANGACTVTADVTVAAAGSYTNTVPAGAVSSANASVSSAGSQSITVTPAPSVSKSFTPGTVAPGTSSTLTITLSNPTAATLTAVGVTDVFPNAGAGAPGNMVLFDTVVTNTCGGTLTDSAGAALAVGSAGLKLVGGSISATNVCTITAHVKAPSGGAYGNTIPAGALTTSGGANSAAAAATLQIASPQVTKDFAATTVAANTPTTMTITLTNVTGATITSLAFTDTYPAGLVNSAVPAVTNTCGGTATASAAATNPGTFQLSGATTLAAGSSCTLTVNVQSAAAGSYTNTIAAGGVSSSIGANAAAASGTLNVARPDIAKAFSAATIPVGSSATLTITLSNPTALAMTAAAFTDTLPAGLTASAPLGTCTGTKTASGGTVTLAGGTIPAAGSCTVIATVTGTTIGLKNNTIPAGGLTVAGPASNGTSADASITVLATPTITKTFLASPILPATGSSTLQIVLANSNPAALTSATFTDTFPIAPGAMTLADLSTTNTCSGSLLNNLGGALAVGSAGIRLTGGTIPSNGSCTITVNVKASAAGDYVNAVAAGALTTANGGANALATSAPLAVRLAAPLLAKAFSPTSIVANTATTLTLTLTNPSTTTAITGVALSDIFPAGMKVFAAPGFSNSCGGTVGSGSAANDTSLALTGATVPFNGAGTASCTVSVMVTSSVVAGAPGLTNTTEAVTSTNANPGNPASANLIVTAPPLTAPTIAKAFGPSTIASGAVSTITFTLGSGNVGILSNGNFTDSLVNMSVASTVIGGGCAGVTNSPALAVGATGPNALNLTVPNVPPGGCTVTVQVTSTTLGANPNSVSGVTTSQVPIAGAGAGPVYLTVVNKPTIAKAFAPGAVSAGQPSTLTLTLSNPTASPLTGAGFTDTYPTGLVNAATPAASTTCTGGSVSAAAGSGALTLNAATVPASGSCTVTVNVTSAAAGGYDNTSGGVASNETGSAGPVSNTATLTVTASGVQLRGFVYADANHNLQRDGGEAGTGLVLYAKLVSAASPAGPALQAVTVDIATGAYAFANVGAGEYFVVIDDNATLADVTPTVPTNWVGTEAGDQIRRNIVVASADVSGLNVGLYNGNLATGRVFRDNGSGAGTPNNAVQDGSEAGLGAVTVRLTNAAGNVTYDSTVTDAAGNYRLWIPAALSGASLRVAEDNPAGHRSVGGAPAGSYDRAADTHAFTYAAGGNITNLNFADVPFETLTANQQKTAAPGDVLFYAHTFTPGSGGSVAFGATSSAGWPQTVLRDTNCNGLVDAGEGVVAASIPATAATPVCVIVKLTVPAGTAFGAQNIGSLQAVFSYANASPPLVVTLTNDDLTTVGTAAGLVLVKSQDNATPLPGGRINYTLAFTNQGSQPLSAIRISDATPASTRFVSAACAGPLAAGLTACTVTLSPAAGATGAVEWTLTGALLPGATGQVVFVVDVAAGP